jgi:flagellar capping protein FliD
VTLDLQAVTANPVTITVGAPAPSQTNITGALQQFVNDYNSAVNLIQQTVNTAPTSETDPGSYNPDSGSLFGDTDLENSLNELRDTLTQPLTANGISTISAIGLSTGASTGVVNQSSVDGELTLNTSQLSQELTSNPQGVSDAITQWAAALGGMLDSIAGPGGDLASRIQGNDASQTSLQTQYTNAMATFSQQEQSMSEQWATVESTISQLKSQGSSLSAFEAGLTSSSSS